jgi:hypothetical protein
LERQRQEALELLEKREIEASGQDYDRIRRLKYSVQDVEAWEESLEKKKARANTGATGMDLSFSNFNHCRTRPAGKIRQGMFMQVFSFMFFELISKFTWV